MIKSQSNSKFLLSNKTLLICLLIFIFSALTSCIDNKVIWKYKATHPITSSPVILNDIVFFGDLRGNVYGLDVISGNRKFNYKCIGTVDDLQLDDKLLYINAAGTYSAINITTLNKVWYFDTKFLFSSRPIIYGNTIFYGNRSSDRLYAYDYLLKRNLWEYKTNGYISTVDLFNNTLFFGGGDKYIYALDLKTRSLIWKYKSSGRIYSINYHNDSVYIVSSDNSFCSIDYQTGKLNWKYNASGQISFPCITKDTVYFGSFDNSLYALDLKGNLKWKYKTAGEIHSKPVLHKGIIYFGVDTGKIYGVEVITGKMCWSFKTEDQVLTSPIIHDDFLYSGSRDGYLYKLKINP